MQGLRRRQSLQGLFRPQVLALTSGAAFGGKAESKDKKVSKRWRLVHPLVVLVWQCGPA